MSGEKFTTQKIVSRFKCSFRIVQSALYKYKSFSHSTIYLLNKRRSCE